MLHFVTFDATPTKNQTLMNPINNLKSLAMENNRQKYPSFPDQYRVTPKYEDQTANGLTKCIVDFLNFSGHQAERISTTGRWVAGKKGPGKWIKGSGTKGSADISATIKGRSVKIEVKIGRDKQSEYQIEYQKRIEKAGGVYIIAKTFQDFFDWYNLFIEQKNY